LTAKEALNSSQSLAAGLNKTNIQSPKQIKTDVNNKDNSAGLSQVYRSCQVSEKKILSDAMDNTSEVKHKIELRYDKTIMNFKSACDAESVASLPRSRSSIDYQKRVEKDGGRSQKSALSQKSGGYSHRSSNISAKSRSPPK
jgi:hypothetical protein